MLNIQSLKKMKMFFRPKKELGQNFLFDKNYLQRIVKSCSIDNNTVIIEIGSGYGSLTNLLAETNCQKIISLEKDEKIFRWLEENNKNEKVTYLCQDALLIDWEKFCLEYKNSSLIVVGNLPYYITNSLIVNLLFCHHLFKSLIFLVQKEVGQKWVASPNNYSSKYSALSVFINYLANTSLVFEIPRNLFNPIPEVDGALVVINLHIENVKKEQLISFLKFLKNCFRSRRKTLWNNLLAFAGNFKLEWDNYFREKNYQTKIRPQNLTSLEYYQLFIYLQKLLKQ
jgi:16S rRNA (adenine1518-N6/adenine1519-N6)-dimethyltransferase